MSDFNVLSVAAGVLSLVTGASYLFPQEGIRGAGRVLGGFAFLLLGAAFALSGPAQSTASALMFAVAGAVTIVCGARKFMRR